MGGSDFRGVIEKNTPLCAHEIGPGLAIRPPTMLATDADWWGSLWGGRVMSSSAILKPASECTAETSRAFGYLEIKWWCLSAGPARLYACVASLEFLDIPAYWKGQA
jgi:hypothetical protein